MYLVWNESITQSEFFGATKSVEKAEKLLKRIKEERYSGKSEEEIEQEELETGENIKITWFENQI